MMKLMAKLIFLPIAEGIESGTYLLYDGACGTGGMLTVAEDRNGRKLDSAAITLVRPATRKPRTSRTTRVASD